jgi:hypothetical protein
MLAEARKQIFICREMHSSSCCLKESGKGSKCLANLSYSSASMNKKAFSLKKIVMWTNHTTWASVYIIYWKLWKVVINWVDLVVGLQNDGLPTIIEFRTIRSYRLCEHLTHWGIPASNCWFETISASSSRVFHSNTVMLKHGDLNLLVPSQPSGLKKLPPLLAWSWMRDITMKTDMADKGHINT